MRIFLLILLSMTAARGERVIILRPSTNLAPLFVEERDELRQAIAAVLPKLRPGASPAPFSEVDAAQPLSDEGRAREGGPICAQAISAAQLRREKFPGALELASSADCHQSPCTLQLTLRRDREQLDHWEAPVEGAPTPAAFVAATRRLHRPKPAEKAAIGLIFHQGDRPPFEISRIERFGAWAIPPQATDLLNAPLAACRTGSTTDQLTLAVATDGSITRCEVQPSVDPTPPAHTHCRCDAMRAVRFDPAVGERRLVLDLMTHAEERKYGARLDSVRSEGWSAQPIGGVPSLAECAEGVTGPTKFDVQLMVDATGHVSQVRVGGERAGCLAPRLKQLAFPCPPTPTASVTATLVLYRNQAR